MVGHGRTLDRWAYDKGHDISLFLSRFDDACYFGINTDQEEYDPLGCIIAQADTHEEIYAAMAAITKEKKHVSSTPWT